jgi:hypothetical protein
MAVVVSEIQFNLGPGSAAVNLRRNRDEVVEVPEWRLGRSFAPEDSPVAYVLDELSGAPLTIRGRFARTDPSIGSVFIRAIPAAQVQVPWWVQNLLPPDLLWPFRPFFTSYIDFLNYNNYKLFYDLWQAFAGTDSNVLGEVKPRLIEFGPNGLSELVSLELGNVRLANRGAGVQNINWLWQFRLPSDFIWRNIGQTSHRVYSTISRPTAPWLEQPFDETNTQLPWTDVLDVSCVWASGALSSLEVAERITLSVFELGSGLIEYGCPIGAHEMYANTPLNFFDCTAFLARLSGLPGNGPYVNCTDCATIVSTFANIMGSDLWQSRMGKYFPAFETFPTLLIGSTQWTSPCGWGLGFMFHEVAWTRQCTAADNVYDACLLVDAHPPIIGRLPDPLLVADMLFGSLAAGQYRDRLAIPTDRAICEPRPLERRRRIVL